MRSFSLVLACSLMAIEVMAGSAYVGCYTYTSKGQNGFTMLTNKGSKSSEGECIEACSGIMGIKYALTLPSGKKNFQCYCAPSEFSYNGFTFSSGSSSGQCEGTDYKATMVDTTFSFKQCYETVSTATTNSVTAPEDCAVQCRSNLYMSFVYVSGQPQCYCSQINPFTKSKSAACGDGAAFFYTHPADQASQGNARKRKVLERMAKEERMKHLCPKSLQACRVHPDNDEDFECLDLSSELESCGGCMYGRIGHPENSTAAAKIGSDCSSLPGVRLSGVTCQSGECVVYACRRGYVLKDGKCIPNRRR